MGSRDALSTADELQHAATLIDQAEVRMDAAMSAAARIAWHTEPSFQPVAVQRWVSICFLQLDQLASLITDLGDLFRKCEPSARRILLGAEVKNTVIDEQKNQARAG